MIEIGPVLAQTLKDIAVYAVIAIVLYALFRD